MNAQLEPTAPQLTARAIILSIVLATVLAAANTYLGLFAGMTIASAIPAAVVSMAVLRALGGGGIWVNVKRRDVKHGVLMLVAEIVLLGNVLIWAIPTTPAGG